MPRIRFVSPDGSEVSGNVPEGTTLLDAAFSVGALIRTTCGGLASCLECAVELEDGTVVTGPTPREIRRLGDVLDRTPTRLACQARVTGAEATVRIPALLPEES